MPAAPDWKTEKRDLLCLLGIPVLLLLINSVWLSNKFDDADTWLYYGHFQRFYNPAPAGDGVLIDYIRTRLPYIVPGAALYWLLSDGAARVALMLLVYCGTILPFWYVMRAHAGRQAAFAACCLLATDMFFVRTIGWQYVDGAVIALQAMTLAFITAAIRSASPRRYYMLAGFTAASMVFTHLAAACMGPIFVGYAYIFLARAKPHMTVAQRMRLPMTAMLWGGLICQIIYGTYLSVVYDYFFVFLFEQLHLAVNEAVFMTGSLPLTFLATSATWLTIHGVALVGCVIALVVSLVRGKSLLDFDVFWFACVSVLFGGLLVFEVLHWSYFLGREGLYASFLLIPSYLAIGALLFGLAGTDWRLAILTAAVFLVSIAYRLVHDGAPPAFLPNPVIGLAAMGGIAVVMPLLFANRRVRVGALLALAVILSLSPWKFIDDTSIRATSRLIRQMTGDRTPRIFFAGDDKVGTGPLRSIVATFTERAWGRHGEFYPDFSKNAWAPIFDFQDKDVVVVLSSSISDVNVPREALARYVAEASILGSFKVNRPDAPIWAHIFQIRPRQR